MSAINVMHGVNVLEQPVRILISAVVDHATSSRTAAAIRPERINAERLYSGCSRGGILKPATSAEFSCAA